MEGSKDEKLSGQSLTGLVLWPHASGLELMRGGAGAESNECFANQ